MGWTDTGLIRAVRAQLVRLSGYVRRPRWEAEFDAEIEHTLDLHTQDGIRQGLGADEARRQAHLRLGSVALVKERYRDRRLVPALAAWARDVRYGARSLCRSRSFSVTVFVVLALSIGANTTALSVFHALVMRSLPVGEPERVVQLFNLRDARSPDNLYSESSWNQYTDLRQRSGLFAGAALRSPVTRLVRIAGVVERVSGQKVSAEFFDLMEVEPVLGRFFRAEEVDPGPGQVVVLSQSAWESDFASDPAVIGTELLFDNGVPFTIVGVAPRRLEALDHTARFTIPYGPRPREKDPAGGRYQAHSDDLWLRLHDGVSRDAALDQIRAIERDWFDRVADDEGRNVYRAYQGRVAFDLPHPLERQMYLMQAGSGLIFLIGCFNVMTLVLGRVNRRRTELSIRLAMGAGLAGVRRLMVVESLLLAGLAAAGALLVARVAVAVLNRYMSILSPHTLPVELDPRILAGTLLVSIAVVGAVNLIPVDLLYRVRRLERIDPGQRTSSRSRRSSRVNDAMVVGQVAGTFVLVIGAGLLLNSFRNVVAVEPGFDAGRVVEGRLDFATIQASYPQRQDAAVLQRRIFDAMGAIPGVQRVGFSMFPLFSRDLRAGGTGPFAGSVAGPTVGHSVHYVSPGFFETMGIPLRAGRVCNGSDSANMVVVDESFRRGNVAGPSLVGQVLPPEQPGVPADHVIGVVGRATLRGLEQRDGQPVLYRCEAVDRGWWEYSILLRSSRPAADVISDMRTQLQVIDPRLPFSYTGTLQSALDRSLTSRRGLTLVLLVFAALATLLSLLGVYAVLARNVVERRREIGIRLALGARRSQIYRLVLGHGVMTTLVGLGLGAAGAAAMSGWMRAFLFDLGAFDAGTYGGAAALLVAAATVACFVPARRAGMVQPTESLRAE